MITPAQRKFLRTVAKYGDRVLFIDENGKKFKIWAGLGNRSGLHSYASTLIREKWEKNGERFINKVEKKAQQTGTFVVQEFQNINRDRGRWVTIKTIEA